MRLFFLNKDGWFEEEISGKLLHASQEDLVLWAYAMMERKNYRNYLITENPERVMQKKFKTVIASHSNQMTMAETR
jgi:hypothetical protein